MKKLLAVFALICISGCTTLTPYEAADYDRRRTVQPDLYVDTPLILYSISF
jgi:hypothetical protein